MLTDWLESPASTNQSIRDEFAGGGMTLVFRRDDAITVSGLSVFADWDGAIRNERFEKVN